MQCRITAPFWYWTGSSPTMTFLFWCVLDLVILFGLLFGRFFEIKARINFSFIRKVYLKWVLAIFIVIENIILEYISTINYSITSVYFTTNIQIKMYLKSQFCFGLQNVEKIAWILVNFDLTIRICIGKIKIDIAKWGALFENVMYLKKIGNEDNV